MKLAIFGYGGHAREVATQIDRPVTFFVSDEFSNELTEPISNFDPKEYTIIVAVSNPQKRQEIVSKLPKETKFFTFIHPTALIMNRSVEIGVGSFIGAYSILTTNIKIGKHAILNRGNQIGHDCMIGDFLSMMPGSIISGNVKMGDKVYMGTNASVIENKFISSDTTIGANGVVIKNINTSGTYVGVPVKKIK